MSSIDPVDAAAALAEPSRRGMFEFIRRQRRPVTRDQAAASVGISRKLAAFHLDKLVEAGLLTARYASPDAVRKPGRTPKVYEPAGSGVWVSIPRRDHRVLADTLVDAVLTQHPDEQVGEAAARVARARGERLGAAERDSARPGRLGAERALALAAAILERDGYEPEPVAATRVRLRNCPYDPLAAKAPDLVCGINHAYISGLLSGLHAERATAVLKPQAGECCVELRPAAAHDAAAPELAAAD